MIFKIEISYIYLSYQTTLIIFFILFHFIKFNKKQNHISMLYQILLGNQSCFKLMLNQIMYFFILLVELLYQIYPILVDLYRNSITFLKKYSIFFI